MKKKSNKTKRAISCAPKKTVSKVKKQNFDKKKIKTRKKTVSKSRTKKPATSLLMKDIRNADSVVIKGNSIFTTKTTTKKYPASALNNSEVKKLLNIK